MSFMLTLWFIARLDMMMLPLVFVIVNNDEFDGMYDEYSGNDRTGRVMNVLVGLVALQWVLQGLWMISLVNVLYFHHYFIYYLSLIKYFTWATFDTYKILEEYYFVLEGYIIREMLTDMVGRDAARLIMYYHQSINADQVKSVRKLSKEVPFGLYN